MNIAPLAGRRRLVAAFAVPALAASALAAGTTSASADPTPSGSAGSSWLVGELNEENLIRNDTFNSNDYGLSIDVAFAAAAGRVDAARARDISDAIAANIDAYIAGDAFGDEGSTYAGAVAKALVLAQLAGADPTSFGDRDLVARLEAQTSTDAATLGRIQDTSKWGDYANTLGQSFAVASLTRVGSDRAADAAAFLLQQQCAAGFFRTGFSAADAPDQTCDGAASPSASTDTTAMAILALQARPNDAAAQAAVVKGIAWLKSAQKANGSFGGDELTSVANSNSTGLAATALASTCEIVAADRAADWVRDLQVGADEAGTPLADELGAIAYDQAAFDTARSEGITDATRDQFRRASAQATPGLLVETAGTPTVSFGKTPKFGRVGKAQTLRIRGVEAGETVCFGDVNDFRPVLGSGGLVKIKVTGDTEGKVRYGATTGPGIAKERIHFLDKTRFTVKTKSRVGSNAKQVAAISGLERGEKVRVFVRGKRVAKGKANAKGKFFTRFDVNAKPGRTRVKVIGQFFNRKGFNGFKVTR